MDFSKVPGIEDLGDLEGKCVLVRVDFNVPLEGAQITSDTRIHAALPTIKKLLDARAKVILASHLGRPKGEGFETHLSLAPVATRLGDLLGFQIELSVESVGSAVDAAIEDLAPGRCLLLENLRFHAEEKKGDETFGRKLAALADAYVNDAFGTCHRSDASMVWPAKLLPSAAGLLVKSELNAMARVIHEPARPYVAVLGGAKVNDKIPLIHNLLPKVDRICIGGGMSYTFLRSQGMKVGRSLCEDTLIDDCKEILGKAAKLGVTVHLPDDHVVSSSMEDETATELNGDIPADKAAFDIGDNTARRFTDAIEGAKTILFNGPMGVFEKERFSNGTRAVVSAIADATKAGAYSVIGGGDSAAAAEEFHKADEMSHVSTGGGASLTLLQGGEMPALAALKPGA